MAATFDRSGVARATPDMLDEVLRVGRPTAAPASRVTVEAVALRCGHCGTLNAPWRRACGGCGTRMTNGGAR